MFFLLISEKENIKKERKKKHSKQWHVTIIIYMDNVFLFLLSFQLSVYAHAQMVDILFSIYFLLPWIAITLLTKPEKQVEALAYQYTQYVCMPQTGHLGSRSQSGGHQHWHHLKMLGLWNMQTVYAHCILWWLKARGKVN